MTRSEFIFCILCAHVSLGRRRLTWALTSGAHVYSGLRSIPKFLTIHAHAHLLPFSSCSSYVHGFLYIKLTGVLYITKSPAGSRSKELRLSKCAFQTLSWSSAVFVVPLHEVTNILSRRARSCTALARIRPTVSFTTIAYGYTTLPVLGSWSTACLFASFKVETN